MTQSQLIIYDSLALIYRGYFAIKSLSAADGTPTNALLGFIKMTQQLESQYKPTHRIAVFDGGLPEERMALVPDYKAQRPPMPDDLRCQLPLVEEYLRLAGIPAVRIEREEADDLVAVIARQAEAAGFKVFIVSSDKDLFQLLNESVLLINPAKPEVPMTAAHVKEKTGVPPVLVADWLALVGDSADNFQGVPGVGVKTAARLLMQYGSIDKVLNALDTVEPERIKVSLDSSRDLIERNRRMVRLRTDVAYAPDWNAMKTSTGHEAGLLAFYRKFNMRSMAASLEDRMNSLF